MKTGYIKMMVLFSGVSILAGGCLFSSDELTDKHIAGNFYMNNFYGKNRLLYKSGDDTAVAGNGNVILENVDSIGWYRSQILAVANGQYFLIDTSAKQIRTLYKNFSDFIKGEKPGTGEYHLKSFFTGK